MSERSSGGERAKSRKILSEYEQVKSNKDIRQHHFLA